MADRIFSVWRPLNSVVEDQPLAFGDGSSISIKDCVGIDHIRRYCVGESNYPLYSSGYRWYYLNRQTRDEVLIFKTHDSDTSVKAMCEYYPVKLWKENNSVPGCPHTSFRKSGIPSNYVPRESIEVRALVFSEEQE